ncbi:MAG: hypothetical protein ACOC33_03525 [bacterium]
MTNKESNVILSLHDKFKNLVEKDLIKEYRFEYNEENEVLDIFFLPVCTIDKIDVNFVLSGGT